MKTMKAVRIHAYGGPEVLAYEDAPRPEAGGHVHCHEDGEGAEQPEANR